MMQTIPKLRESSQFPVTLLLCVASCLVTLLWWSGVDIHGLFANGYIRRGELWRLVSAVFIHGDILHIAFNLYWVWMFGSLLEKAYGSIKFLGIFLLFAVGASAWDYALSSGGIGISGVVYGFFGMLLLLRNDNRFIHALDKSTIALFLGWFMACIILGSGLINTSGNQYILGVFVVVLIGAMNLFPVLYKRYGIALNIIFVLAISAMMNDGLNIANVAHGAGLLLGLLLGFSLASRSVIRSLGAILVIVMASAGITCAVYLRPMINFSQDAARYERYWCYHALKDKNNHEAFEWCAEALRYDSIDFDDHINMGIAHQRMGNMAEAEEYFRKARMIDPERFEERYTDK